VPGNRFPLVPDHQIKFGGLAKTDKLYSVTAFSMIGPSEANQSLVNPMRTIDATPGIDTVGMPCSRARTPYSASSHLMNTGSARPSSAMTCLGIRHSHQPL